MDEEHPTPAQIWGDEGETPSEPREEEAEEDRPSCARQVVETALLVAAAFLLAVVIRNHVITTYVVPTGSMQPTIELDDRIICNRLAYRFGEPEIGDVVVLENPDVQGPPLVKRIVALGGHTLDIQDGWVYLDGVRQEEPWVVSDRRDHYSLVEPIEIPVGQVWLMGDNRARSGDSRVFGSVSEDSLYGEAFVIYWPLSRAGLLE